MSGCSWLFSDVLELRCNVEILRYGMGKNLGHNSIQTAFKISDLALQSITLLIIQRVSNTSYCSYAEHLLPIGSSRIRLLEQTDAQGGYNVILGSVEMTHTPIHPAQVPPTHTGRPRARPTGRFFQSGTRESQRKIESDWISHQF